MSGFAITRPVKAEGDADTDDVFDPCLHLGGHAEIIHRHPGYNHIGTQQFGKQFVAFGQRLMHPVFALGRFGEGRMDPVTGHRIGGIGPDIAIDDFRVRAFCQPVLDELCGEAARVRTMRFLIGTPRAGAAVDMKNFGHHVLHVMKLTHP